MLAVREVSWSRTSPPAAELAGPFRVGYVFSQWAVPPTDGRVGGGAHRKAGCECECEGGCAAKGRTARALPAGQALRWRGAAKAILSQVAPR